ncbi:MAG: seryl-tRNA synthetase, partial [Bradymonadia bacterium]
MLDQRYVLANLDEVRRKTLRRGESSFDFDGYAQLAETRKTALSEFETTRAEQKSSSGAMRGLTPGSDEFNETRAALKTLSDRAKAHDEQAKQHEVSLQNALLELPNLLDDETPDGTSEDDNVEVRVSGPTPTFTFDAQDHVTLGEGLGLMDNEAAGRVTGARFVFLKG